MLERFIHSKSREIANLRMASDQGLFPCPYTGERPDFRKALLDSTKPAVIAEYKRASPSRGLINSSLTIQQAVRQYEEAGAAALSVLTEEEFFMGEFDFLEKAARTVRLPILRKDFIFDPLQVAATVASPVSALLLIARLVPDVRSLRNLREQAEAYGLECVVEVFDSKEIGLARDSGAKIIQINARDLSTLAVDREACLELIKKARPLGGEIWIQASGISLPEHLREAADAGFNAVLVGSSLMCHGKPGQALKTLLGGHDAPD